MKRYIYIEVTEAEANALDYAASFTLAQHRAPDIADRLARAKQAIEYALTDAAITGRKHK